MQYSTSYVHKIAPKPDDKGPDVWLSPSTDAAETKTLAKALRERRILCSGERLRSHRVEKDGKIVCFPASSIWHSITLTPVK